jgi:hypothetical protein
MNVSSVSVWDDVTLTQREKQALEKVCCFLNVSLIQISPNNPFTRACSTASFTLSSSQSNVLILTIV